MNIKLLIDNAEYSVNNISVTYNKNFDESHVNKNITISIKDRVDSDILAAKLLSADNISYQTNDQDPVAIYFDNWSINTDFNILYDSMDSSLLQIFFTKKIS